MCLTQLAVALAFLTAVGLGSIVQPEEEGSIDDLGTVIFSSVVFRHGDRAPLHVYPTDPYKDVNRYWPNGLGQLTEVGEEQQYELGRFLRTRYSEALPQLYHYNNTYVRSTTKDRALISAQCTLAALYPATQGSGSVARHVTYQPVPIHSAELDKDTLLWSTFTCASVRGHVALVKQTEELRCVRNLTSAIFEEVSRFAGDANLASYVYDTLHAEDVHNLTLPDWAHEYYPSPLREIDMLEDFISSTATRTLQRLIAGPLLKEILQNAESKLKGELMPDRFLYLYSGHDYNVVGLLQALGVFNGLLVPYSSAVIFELRILEDQPYLTVWFRNSTERGPHLLQVRGCEELCPVQKFEQLVKPLISEDWDAECEKMPSKDDPQEDLQVPHDAILPEWRQCFDKHQAPVQDDASTVS